MKQLNLSFKIDKQYENWQFELEALEDRFYGYHSYRYIGKKIHKFLNYSTYKTELIFNGDYLTAVIITIKRGSEKRLDIIMSVLNQQPLSNLQSNNSIKIGRIIYSVILNKEKREIIIIYGKIRFVKRILKYDDVYKRHTFRSTI